MTISLKTLNFVHLHFFSAILMSYVTCNKRHQVTNKQARTKLQKYLLFNFEENCFQSHESFLLKSKFKLFINCFSATTNDNCHSQGNFIRLKRQSKNDS